MAVKQRLDTPTNNFATLNPLNYYYSTASNPTVSEGNLKFATTGGTYRIGSTLAVTSGKWYFEAYRNDATAVGNEIAIGVVDSSKQLGTGQYGGPITNAGANANEWALVDRAYACNNTTYINTGLSSNSINQGKIVQVLIDMNLRSISWGVNNVWYYNAFTNLSDSVSPVVYTGTGTVTSNFGQDPTFAGNKTPTKVYTDANGQGRFYYQPPEGALALCTANIGGANYKSAPTSYVSDETNTKILTYNGNVEQVPYSPYATDGYSLYSSNAGLKLTDTAANFNYLHTNTTHYTISFWMYRMKDMGASEIILDNAGGTTSKSGFNMIVDGGGTDKLRIYINGGTTGSNAFKFESNYLVPLRKWVHVSFVFDYNASTSSDKGKLYIDGSLYDSGTHLNNNTFSSSDAEHILTLGSDDAGTTEFYGYIADFRIVKEQVHTQNYTPPSLTDYSVSKSNQDILISASSVSIKDSNTTVTAKTVTPVGSGEVSIQAWSPYTTDAIEFGTEYRTPETAHEIGSFSFDGSGDYLTIPGSSDTAFGTGAFTVEFWLYVTNLSANTYHCLIDFRDSSTSGGDTDAFGFFIHGSAATAGNIYIFQGSSITFNQVLKGGEWNHIALVRTGTGSNGLSLYLNGVKGTDATLNTDLSATNTVHIGKYPVNNSFDLHGYMTDIRIIKGVAAYTGNFTPPISELSTTQSSGSGKATVSASDTKLLLQPYKSYDADNLLTSNFSYNKDSSPIPKSLTYVGNSKVVDFSPYKSGANGSFSFDGSGDYISIPSLNASIGTGDFTIEFWAYLNVATSGSFFDTSNGFQYYINSSTINTYDRVSGASGVSGNVQTSNLKNWVHHAIVRDGGTIKLYENGIQAATESRGTNFSFSTLNIGTNAGAGSEYLNGHIADFRIVGSAVYTSNFTPPYDELTAITNTKLLLQPGALASSDPAKKPFEHFKPVKYVGNATSGTTSGRNILVDFAPDLVWVKDRDAVYYHQLHDSVRGTSGGVLYSNSTDDQDSTYALNNFTGASNNGFSLGANSSAINAESSKIIAWNWKAGGATPSKTYYVKVVDDSGNKYRFIDDVTNTNHPILNLQKGGTYTFDQSDSTNDGHPLLIYADKDKTAWSGAGASVVHKLDGSTVTSTNYGNTTNFNAASSRQTILTVPSQIASEAATATGTLSYQCYVHGLMGGSGTGTSSNIQATATHGQTEFGGSIIPIVSANKEAGFSIISYTAQSTSVRNIPHGLNKRPDMFIIKQLDGSNPFIVWHSSFSNPTGDFIRLNTDQAKENASNYFGGEPNASLIYVGSDSYSAISGNNMKYICYAWHSVEGYSAFGSVANLNNDEFVYLGFKPAWVMLKRTSTTSSWSIYDNARNPHNVCDKILSADAPNLENTYASLDLLSNGFKARSLTGVSGGWIYMAFAEAPVNFSNAR